MKVKLDDEFAPFLRPNQYVNYSADSQAVAIAKKLTASCGTDLEKITAVYNYVISHLSYDYYKAETVQSGYLSDIDAVLKSGKGICYDYAAVMTAMRFRVSALRQRGGSAAVIRPVSSEVPDYRSIGIPECIMASILSITNHTGSSLFMLFITCPTWCALAGVR